MYNPLVDDLEVLPAIVYFPESEDNNWFLGEKKKLNTTAMKKFV